MTLREFKMFEARRLQTLHILTVENDWTDYAFGAAEHLEEGELPPRCRDSVAFMKAFAEGVAWVYGLPEGWSVTVYDPDEPFDPFSLIPL